MAARPLGIDVSSYQGSINWSSVAGAVFLLPGPRPRRGPAIKTRISSATKTMARPPACSWELTTTRDTTCTPAPRARRQRRIIFGTSPGTTFKGTAKSLMPMLDVEASLRATPRRHWQHGSINGGQTVVAKRLRGRHHGQARHLCERLPRNYFDGSVAQWTPWIANYNGQDPQSGTRGAFAVGYNIWGTWVAWAVHFLRLHPRHLRQRGSRCVQWHLATLVSNARHRRRCRWRRNVGCLGTVVVWRPG